MILIDKKSAPNKLNEGVIETSSHCAAYETNKREYETGKKFEFKGSIYRHKEVKAALKRAQHGKCCYCEGKFEAHAGGDIEHYRPKGSIKQRRDSDRLYPGYFWLAYTWENLYWSCQTCNRSKSDLFPLQNDQQRARSSTDNLENEIPLILDPGGSKNPRCHIKFRDEIAVSNTDSGKTTIEVVDLNRLALQEERREYLNQIQNLFELIYIAKNSQPLQSIPNLDLLVQDFRNTFKPYAKFSAMANDYLTSSPR